jgi:branched-chain amino acid transport system substrate-binding protein
VVSRKKRLLTVAAAAAAIVTAGCSSSSKSASSTSTTVSGSSATTSSGSSAATSSGSSGTSSGSSGGTKTVTVGVLTDVTGISASSNKTFETGVAAGANWAETQGYKVKYIVADTGSSLTGTVTAAQELVDHDHVLAVIAGSSFTFAAAPFLEQHGIPVIGVAQDAGEWITDSNMFSMYGAIHTNEVSTTAGLIFKLLGATKIGALGYGISPSSAQAAKAAAISSEAVGLQAPYVNTSFPFGGTDVEPVALAMKADGVDGFTSATEPNTAYSLITALRQSGADLKAGVLSDGYGVDTLQAGPGALQSAQGVYFILAYEPVEMNTPATQQFVTALKNVGFTATPSEGMYNGYLSIALLVDGLQGAGANPTHASLISSLSKIHNWNAAGLFGTHTMDINNKTSIIGGPDNCEWVTKLVGTNFQLVPGGDPICGTDTGKTVAP